MWLNATKRGNASFNNVNSFKKNGHSIRQATRCSRPQEPVDKAASSYMSLRYQSTVSRTISLHEARNGLFKGMVAYMKAKYIKIHYTFGDYNVNVTKLIQKTCWRILLTFAILLYWVIIVIFKYGGWVNDIRWQLSR